MANTKIPSELIDGTLGVAGITSSADATAITIDSSENVGIGTTPDSTRKLHIKDSSGNAYRAVTIEADNANADAGLEFIGGGNNVFNIQQPHDSAGLFFYDRTNSATRLTITEDGVVDANGGLGFKGNAITTCSGFTGTAGHYYWIKPSGAMEPVYAEYSGDNYKGRGKGYFCWWHGYGDAAAAPNTNKISVNFLDMGFKFYEVIVEDMANTTYPSSAPAWEYAYWSTQQTFNSRGMNTEYATSSGVGNGTVRAMWGQAGGHGLYDTTIGGVCSWGNLDANAIIGSGFDGSCGTYGNGDQQQSPVVLSTGISLKLGRPNNSAYFLESTGAFKYWFNF